MYNYVWDFLTMHRIYVLMCMILCIIMYVIMYMYLSIMYRIA